MPSAAMLLLIRICLSIIRVVREPGEREEDIDAERRHQSDLPGRVLAHTVQVPPDEVPIPTESTARAGEGVEHDPSLAELGGAVDGAPLVDRCPDHPQDADGEGNLRLGRSLEF